MEVTQMAMLRKNHRTEITPRKTDDASGMSRGGADPWFSEMDRWFDAMRRDFASAWGLRPSRIAGFPSVRAPALDVKDDGADLVVTAELPGVSKEDLEIQVTEDGLEITARAERAKEETDEDYVYRERSVSAFEHTVPLPAPVVADKVVADLKDGVLEVRLPKREPTPRAKPVKVKVQ